MELSQRYKQAAKEARWALGLAIFYVIGWCVCAYLPKDSPGPIGFPLWFELSCIYLPILFYINTIKFFKLHKIQLNNSTF